MSDSIKFNLPNPEPMSIRELEERGKRPDLASEMEIANVPETGEDIAHLIHEGMTEIRLNGDDLSNEAQFIQRLDADIREFSRINGIKPVPSMEQFADIVAGTASERKIPQDFPLTPDNFRKFYEFLTKRYAISLEDTKFIQDPDGPNRQERTVRATEKREFTNIQKSVRGFWGRLYLAISRKEEEETLPERLRERLQNIVNEMDSEVRETRLESLAAKISRFPADRMNVVVRALYEIMFGKMRGKAFADEEREAFYTRLADAAEFVRPATEAGDYTAKKLSQAIGDLVRRKDGIDRTKPGGVRNAHRRASRLLTAFGSVVEEPFALLKSSGEFYSGERIATRLARFAPMQHTLFLAALRERLDDVESDEELRKNLEAIISAYPSSQKSETERRKWSETCADFLNDVLTRPEKPEPTIVEVASVDADVSNEAPVEVESQGAERREKIKLDTPERIVEYLREGGKRVNIVPAVRATMQLDDQGAKRLYELLAPVVLEDGRISDSDLRIRAGLSYKPSEIDSIQKFIVREGTSGSGSRQGWEAFFLIARRNRKFRFK